MKKIFIFLLVVPILFNNCASILNGKVQKNISVRTKNSKSVVYVNDTKQGSGRSVKSKMKRDGGVKQIRIETEGYKDQYIVHYQNQKSPLHILSWVPFGVLFYPPFTDYGIKSFNYKKEVSVREKLIPIKIKNEDDKYLFVSNTAFDIDEENLKVRKIRHRSLKKNKKNKFKEVDSNSDKLNFDNSIFTDALNEILVNYKYTDTTNTIFKSKTNSAYLSATIKELDLQHVYQSAARRYMSFVKAEVTIEWEFQDIYKQTKYEKKYKSLSGEFSYNYYSSDAVTLAVKDAISASFLKFISSNQVKKLLKKGKQQESKLDIINLKKGNTIQSLPDAINSSVTVKVKEGHGSGFKISNDGYIITNFHVVASSKDDINIIFKDGSELKAKLIRQNEELDLALLKVDTSFDVHFNIPNEKSYTIGEDIFAIGTPKTIELGQTLSKGIISGERSNQEVQLIQTDASVNNGNSGGPLINNKGDLLGVVNAKLSGFGVEGLGFAIPAELILKALSISFE
ncbi:trypsin-like peptidase domain-containing protein [Winogradskyella sp.]|jgi:S1-C subfamily serine protease|uniref:S1C family serine protease n=1 Tax=Winogradskyella sp. TaxID=1883156 RepID=UPI0025EE62B4|nr:trypsin-like peptidase domain-containing protein [Winogradskyella sp.]MCT4628737.1 trypsin-like peptidase domain-containing protein [Winogradskyella sp.]